MKLCIIFLFVFTQFARAQTLNSNENPPLNSNRGTKTIYFLKYYFEEKPDQTIFNRATGRSVSKNGSFCLIDFDVTDLNKSKFSLCYDKAGIPISLGNDKDLIISKDSVKLNFRGRDTTIRIDVAKMKNKTNFWFWKYKPKVGETEIVGSIRKNFVTNKVDFVYVSYSYLGKNKQKIMGKTAFYNLVKSYALNGQSDVYDETWYDHNGMMVKERHVVGKNGVRIGELTKIVKDK